MIDLRLGNAYELIKEVEDNSVNLIVIDPPYSMQKIWRYNKQRRAFSASGYKKVKR